MRSIALDIPNSSDGAIVRYVHMRFFTSLAVVFAIATSAQAAPPAPDISITWTEGEVSMDMSLWTTTITVTGTKVHYELTYDGRMSGTPMTKPKQGDTVVKDPKKLAAALAALDKIPVVPDKKGATTQNYSGQDESGCITRGKVSRCTDHRGSSPETDEFKAFVAIKALLLEGAPVGPLGP